MTREPSKSPEWRDDRLYVLSTLRDEKAKREKLEQLVGHLVLEFTVMKTKWGLVTAIMSTVFSAIVTVVIKLLSNEG